MPRNLSSQINKYLSPEVVELIKRASQKAQNQGQKLYLVGGIVRDLILDKTSFDLDFAIEGNALTLARTLGRELGCRITSHPRFGTANTKLNTIQIDIATARSETYARPGALPQVIPATLSEDLFRRDFTINAMALDLSPSHFGDLIDPLKGEKDLKNRLVRVIHEKSFIDDATRIFRAIRYEQRLDFVMEKHTLEWAQRDKGFINSLSGDRIRREIELIFREEFPEKSMSRGEELEIWKVFNPGLRGNKNIRASFEKLRRLNLQAPYPLPLLFSIFFFTLDEEVMENLIKRLNTPKAVTEVLRDTVKLKGMQPQIVSAKKDKAALFHRLKEFSPQAILALAVSSQRNNLSEALFHYYNKLRFIKTALKGKDLISLGFASGPALGEALNKLLDARITGQVKSKKDEVEFVKNFLL